MCSPPLLAITPLPPPSWQWLWHGALPLPRLREPGQLMDQGARLGQEAGEARGVGRLPEAPGAERAGTALPRPLPCPLGPSLPPSLLSLVSLPSVGGLRAPSLRALPYPTPLRPGHALRTDPRTCPLQLLWATSAAASPPETLPVQGSWGRPAPSGPPAFPPQKPRVNPENEEGAGVARGSRSWGGPGHAVVRAQRHPHFLVTVN